MGGSFGMGAFLFEKTSVNIFIKVWTPSESLSNLPTKKTLRTVTSLSPSKVSVDPASIIES